MRVKLTKVLPAACSLLFLSVADSLPSHAFPFFHRKPQAVEQPAVVKQAQSLAPTDANATPAAPAFRPYNPPFHPSSTRTTPGANPTTPPTEPVRQSSVSPLPAEAFQSAQSVPIEQSGNVPTLQPGNSPLMQPPDSQSQTIIHSPPELPERPPIPPPPVVQAPLMISSGDPTPPLSWRAVAYKLWTTPEGLPPKRSKSQSSFPFSTAITMKALIKALGEAGWNTSQFSASAGHLLAVKAEAETSKLRLIFAAHPGEGGNTVVRAATEPDSKNFDKTQIESIFSRAQDIAARNDLL
jgi:hypothetical protein